MSDTCDTVVPFAAPRYNTLQPGGMWMLPTPPTIAAANLDRKGFHTRYSIFSVPSCEREKKQVRYSYGLMAAEKSGLNALQMFPKCKAMS